METTVSAGIEKSVSKSPLAVNTEKGIYKNEYQKEGTMSVELRQEVTTTTSYPSARAANNLNDSLFSNDDFGFEKQDFVATEKRVAWILVPANATIESVVAKLAEAKEAMLYKMLSNRPILTEDQLYAINNGVGTTTMEDYANNQVVRYPDNHEKAGQIILDTNGKVQYRKVFFSTKKINDTVDMRTAEPSDFFATAEITEELSKVSGATIIANQGLGGN